MLSAIFELVDQVEDLAHVLVVVDHGVVIRALRDAGLTETLGFRMGPEVHVGVVDPGKEGLARLGLALDEVDRFRGDLVINCFHPLLVQRAGVLADLFAHLAEARVYCLVVLVTRLAIEHAARSMLEAPLSSVK